MTYRGHVENGQITLDEAAVLPEGANVSVEVLPKVRITGPKSPVPRSKSTPIEMAGGSLSDELIQDRR